MFDDIIALGDERIFGGSIAKVVGIGTAPRGLVLLIECADLFAGVRKLVGPATYGIGPLSDDQSWYDDYESRLD